MGKKNPNSTNNPNHTFSSTSTPLNTIDNNFESHVAKISVSAFNMNLSVLQRQDASIQSIIAMSSHVVVYIFDSSSKSWSRQSCEGSLFIFQRSKTPQFGLIVINRLSTENMIEYFDSRSEIEISEPYILYRNIEGVIRGLWFYLPEERSTVAAILAE
eukprot:Sdes_comp14957_c0_seq2m3674